MKSGVLTYLRFSFALRLLVLYLAIFMVSTTMVIGIAYWVIVKRPLALVETQVGAEARALAQVYIVDGRAALVGALGARLADYSLPRPFHVFLDAEGRPVVSNLPSWPSKPQAGFFQIEADRYQEGAEIDYQALSIDRLFADGTRLIVGRDIEDIVDREELLLEALAWGGGMALLLGTIGGVFVSIAVGQRLENITQAARKVIAGDLSGRVEQKGTGDDFDKLAETLNLMLSRIEMSVEAISRVSDSIAHELRLPLTRLHADLEDLAEVVGKDAGTRLLMQQAMDEVQRLRSVFESLLRIARIETGRHEMVQAPLDLRELLVDAAELYQPEADEKGLRLDYDLPDRLAARGDADLLFQAVSNLLDNAIKYSPQGARIRLQAAREGDIVIRIENEGSGIAPEHRDRVIERFYRAPEAAALPGLGLGLSLVQAVIRGHGGALNFVDTEQGFAVEVRLPA